MNSVKKKVVRLFYLSPVIQIAFLLLHKYIDPSNIKFIGNLVIIVVSINIASIAMYFVMLEKKDLQYITFLSDTSAESRMIEKIDEKRNKSKYEKLKESGKELSYNDFINLYFSCFKKQPSQVLYFLLNWGSCLIVLLNMIKPITDNEIAGNQFWPLFLFVVLFVLLFSIITYFYSMYLKAKMETRIIEEYIYKNQL